MYCRVCPLIEDMRAAHLEAMPLPSGGYPAIYSRNPSSAKWSPSTKSTAAKAWTAHTLSTISGGRRSFIKPRCAEEREDPHTATDVIHKQTCSNDAVNSTVD